MIIHNPILTGMHPDPSICRVGGDFYLVNSTFEYFPGIPVYHSTDLIHWEQLGHVLSRPEQLDLPKGAPNCIGIYAPTIRYDNGLFYCVCTNVGDHAHKHGNFFCTTKDPREGWSDPVWTDLEGIDPSLYFEDGHMYYTGTDESIYLCEIDPKTGARIGTKQYIWGGSGANNPEGPHLYHINGMYYLMIAEGGTESGHMVTIARSHTITGPYESCPANPVLTNRGTATAIKAVGHADLVEDPNGNWWAVCLCFRPLGYPFTHNLGRETCLVPVTWENGWPVMGENTRVNEAMEVDRPQLPDRLSGAGYVPCSEVQYDCTAPVLHPSWNTIYCPKQGLIRPGAKGIELCGNGITLSEDEEKACLVRRQEHFAFEFRATILACPDKEGEEAGLGVYMNERHHYEAVFGVKNGVRCLYVRRKLGTMICEEHAVPYEGDRVTLWITGDRDAYHMGYEDAAGIRTELGNGECRKLTTECGGCFTGNYLDLYATGITATVTECAYSGNDET